METWGTWPFLLFLLPPPPIKVFHTSHLFSESYYDDMLCDDEFAGVISPHSSNERTGSGAFFSGSAY